MKKITFYLYVAAFALLVLPASCDKTPEENPVKTFDLAVRLTYPEGFAPAADVKVTLRNTITGSVDEKATNAEGAATFTVTAGVYEAAATERRSVNGSLFLFNGVNSITVADDYAGNTPLSITLTESKASQIIIKEVYTGGCPKDDGSGAFQRDPYVIIYNNTDVPTTLDNLAIGGPLPANAQGSNAFIGTDGKLSYENEGWMPSGFGVWQFREAVTIGAGQQVVIALNAAINHTNPGGTLTVYSQSINFANPAYYVTHDLEVWNNSTYYPSPSEVIPTSHYLKAYKLAGATGNAWVLSTTSPGFFFFRPADGIDLGAYAATETNRVTTTSASQVALKVPVDWIFDGVESFLKGNTGNKKRFPASIDAGYVYHSSGSGYTIYRNVDKEATEAIPENAGKLVYGYSLGTEDSTDPSGIDAEASSKAGARIIYQDTNNSTNDFHLRSRASLRD
jgi:hypothetical protein